MAEDILATLYKWSEEMTTAGEAVKEKYEDTYKSMIEHLKSSSDTKIRILAAQNIARFFKHFPAHEEAAFDSIVDLCESIDVDVRKHATIAMIAICRDCKHLVSKAADILIQLYQTNQQSEVNLINLSLTTLLNLDIQKFLQSFFTNFEDGTEIIRERALKFLSNKLQQVAASALTKEVEEQLLTYSKKAMEDVTKDEFITFIGILTKLKIAKTATGQAMIVLVIKSQAELDKDFDVNDKDALDKFLLCTQYTIPLLSQYNRADEYINYICKKTLPHLSSLSSSGNDLNVLQALAEMSPYVHPELTDLEGCQDIVFKTLLEYLPNPTKVVEESQIADAKANSENTVAIESGGDTNAKSEISAKPEAEESAADGVVKTEDMDAKQTTQETTNSSSGVTTTVGSSKGAQETTKSQKEVDFLFTHIEYLIYTFHQFGRLRPEYYDDAKVNEMKVKLHHLAVGCQKYMQILSTQLRGVRSEDLKKEENKLRSVALRTTKNISTLVKDLFKKPPQFKSTVLLSCKPLTARPIETSTTSATNTTTAAVNSSNNNNNNNNNRSSSINKGQQNNNGNYKGHFNRQAGQKHKYRQSYQSNSSNNNKRARHAR